MFEKFLKKNGGKVKTNETQPPVDPREQELIDAIKIQLGGVDVTDDFSLEKIAEDEKRRKGFPK